MQAAEALGRELALRGMTCVYGGSSTGMMNALAESVLAAGGKVTGVTVQALKDKENFHRKLTELHVRPNMHERKQLMVQLSDGFIAMPGGVGTLEEFFEVYTLAQLGFHKKPCGLLDVNGFFAPLDRMLDLAEKEGFMKNSHRQSILRAEEPAQMLEQMQLAIEKKCSRQ